MYTFNKLIVLLLCVAGLSYWLFSSTSEESSSMRKADFYQASLKAEPLIEAINKYAVLKKSAPKQLDELIPRFIKEIPDTGLEGCNSFKYINYGSGRIVVLWYDLGSRHGQPVSKESRYPDGDSGHAILTFTIGEGDHVIDAKFDRMPKEFQQTEFDSEQWLAGNGRIEMAPDLPEKYELSRMPRTVLESLLGHPDGQRVLRDAPWELRINCPRSLTERDILFYWPGESYPEQIYGGNTELIGKWLYVH
ncbi:MAG: hypothetical protein KDI43_15970 [Gammaproteobacteria bacterium]|nr:hypothetical protein [Gammaproteobacteria bacterium]MCP5444087.1 hypothetical protein [Chromatiaceae bacterium]